MTIPEMLGQSGTLTLLGMGVVFSFLIILIIFMKLVALFVKATGMDKEEEQTSAAPSAASVGQDQAIVAAIAAAINEKQKNQGVK